MSYDKPGIIGPNYKYHKQIKSADEMGMGTDGDQLDDNIAGLGAYAGIIFDGRSNANKSGYNRPLGNSFFIKTGQKCKSGEDEVDMMKYVNNIPSGSVIPGRKGLIPGIAENVVAMIPTDILSSFMDGPNVECVESCQLVGKAGSRKKKCLFVNIFVSPVLICIQKYVHFLEGELVFVFKFFAYLILINVFKLCFM